MHELGIVFHIINSVEEVGRENELKSVASVTVELGEVSGVVPEYLTDCWNWAVKKSELLNGAKLKLETINAVTLCNDCQRTYSTVQYAKVCPYCHSENTYLVTGNEMSIKEIEAC
jgi:hydrogenase nickel incorporation protein HypA/HybF